MGEEGRASSSSTSLDCIDWAFAGKCRSQKDPTTGRGLGSRSHTVWDHWIDSKGDEEVSNEADMTIQYDLTVLEEGMTVTADGKEQRYEELWEELYIEPLGKKQNRHCIVLRADNMELKMKGLVIKIGGWCQGIMKKGDELTVERWQLKPSKPDDDEKASEIKTIDDDPSRTRNNWVRTFKFGPETLACRDVCENADGKLGSTIVHLYGDKENLIEWRIIEEYYW